MRVSAFDYELPPELIAQHPPATRTASRLLHLDARTGALRDLMFKDFADLVDARATGVQTDTRSIKARLTGKNRTGGKVELSHERAASPREGLALIRASHPPSAGTEI